jgi:glycosyltransferase involved in cell wall biosynthesis
MANFNQTIAEIDIGLALVTDTTWHRSRSYLKWLDYAMLARPCVCSPTIYDDVVKHGRTGFLARTPKDWVEQTSRLIESPRIRRRIGDAARADVLAHHTFRTEAHRWAAAYRDALKRVHQQEAA